MRLKGNLRGSDEMPSTRTASGRMLPRLPSTEPPESKLGYRSTQRRSVTESPKDMTTSPRGIVQTQSPFTSSTTRSPQKAGHNSPGNTRPGSAVGDEAVSLQLTQDDSEDSNARPVTVANGPTFVTQTGRIKLRPLTSDGAAAATTGVSNAAKSTSQSNDSLLSSLLRGSVTTSATSKPLRRRLPKKAQSCVGEELLSGNRAVFLMKTGDGSPDAADDRSQRRRERQRRRSVTFVVAETSSASNDIDSVPCSREKSLGSETRISAPRDTFMQALAAYDIDSAGVDDPRQVIRAAGNLMRQPQHIPPPFRKQPPFVFLWLTVLVFLRRLWKTALAPPLPATCLQKRR